MLVFINIDALWLLLLLPPMIYITLKQKSKNSKFFSKEVLDKISVKSGGISRKVRNLLLVFSIFFMIIATSRPAVEKGDIEVDKKLIDIVVGFDISKSMFIDDVYPTRFDLAKRKFDILLNEVKNTRIAVVGYSSQTFLISPFSEDYSSLKFLVEKISTDSLNLHGTNILNALKSLEELYEKDSKKAFLIFSDGGDKKSFTKEIAYAKKHNISVFVYAIASKKGGVLRDKSGIVKDKNGDIIVLKINENIEKLALETGGTYMHWTLLKNDIGKLVDDIQSRFKAKEENRSKIKDTKELFYYPLFLSILLFFMANFSFRAIKL